MCCVYVKNQKKSCLIPTNRYSLVCFLSKGKPLVSTCRISRRNEQEIKAGKGAVGNNLAHLTAEQQQIIKNAESISTAKTGKQVTVPRDLNEQIFWKQVEANPSQGSKLPGVNNDPRFPESAGFQKMQATHQLPDGSSITIHYQYNSYTGKAYDMKIDSVKPKWPQPGISIKE